MGKGVLGISQITNPKSCTCEIQRRNFGDFESSMVFAKFKPGQKS